MNIIEYADRDMAAIDIANVLAGTLEAALLHEDHVSFAVPGGSTPGPVFDSLCAADLDWARVHVFPTDERWVAQDDPRSNAGLIAGRLLTSRAGAATLLPLYAPADDPEEVLAEIESQLVPELPVSVLLLGMGEDMHTASLFAGAPGVADALISDAPILAVTRPDDQPEARVTLTARVLDGALSKHLVIFGEAKRAALEKALDMPPEQAPINAVLSGMTVHWAA